jgi:RNA polymerase sigma factor (sigma-70 family)
MINQVERRSQLTPMQDLDLAFKEHFAEICRRTYYLTGDRGAAEELAQETFVRLWEKPPGDAGNLAGWLHRVATNLAFNHLRRERPRQAKLAPLIEGEGTVVHIDDQVGRSGLTATVQEILSCLSPRERMLLLLKNEGMSYREIGAALSIEEGSVGSLLLRARRRFRKLYLDKTGGEVDVL